MSGFLAALAPFAGPIATVAAGLGSAIYAGKRADKASKAKNKLDTKLAASKFKDLRAAAKAGGFNPLTALYATGGAGYGAGSISAPLSGSPPPLASIQAITTGLQDAGAVIDGTKEREDRRIDAESALLEAQRDGQLQRNELNSLSTRQEVGEVRYIAPKEDSKLNDVIPALSSPGSLRPVSRPTLWSGGSTTVFTPDGRTHTIPRVVADRLRLDPEKNFEVLTMGDMEELAGEVGGNVIATPMLPGIIEQNLGGLMGDKTTDDREDIIRRRNELSPDPRTDVSLKPYDDGSGPFVRPTDQGGQTFPSIRW